MSKPRCSIMLSVLAASVMAVAAGSASAQSYPSKPIRLVIPFTAGSGSDFVHRPIAEQMSTVLGQPVIVDPRPGGGTLIGALYVKNQPADGYTIFAGSNSMVVKSMVENPQIDVRKDYTPIAPVSVSALILAVNAEKSKARTLKEFLDEARANPGKLNYASYGTGSGSHVFMEMLLSAAKAKVVHVPFQGTVQSLASTVAGDTQLAVAILVSLKPFVAPGGSGKLRIIAASTTERFSLAPDVPGMKESGFPDMEYVLWGGFFGPAGLPRDIVDKLNQATNQALRDPKVIEVLIRTGVAPLGGKPEELTRLANREYNDYVKLTKDTGFKFD